MTSKHYDKAYFDRIDARRAQDAADRKAERTEGYTWSNTLRGFAVLGIILLVILLVGGIVQAAAVNVH